MATRPGFIWSGTEWVSIGNEAAVMPVKYQTTAPTSPSTGDIWIDSDDDVPSVNSTVYYTWKKTMAGGETSVSGTDDNSLTLSYTVGYEQVFINGVLQVRGTDYTATTGTSITGMTALSAGDIVTVTSIMAYNVGDTYTQSVADGKFSPITTTGLVLLNTTTLSAASSITINNVFSSTYTNYRIINNTGNGVLYLQLSLSGTANTSSYGYSAHYTDWNSNHGVWYANAGSATAAPFTSSYGSADIYNPAIATTTVFQGLGGDGATNGTFGGKHSVSTAYDGIKIYPGSGTMTGTIQIYGYK